MDGNWLLVLIKFFVSVIVVVLNDFEVVFELFLDVKVLVEVNLVMLFIGMNDEGFVEYGLKLIGEVVVIFELGMKFILVLILKLEL